MIARPRPFQEATIETAVRALTTGSRRFLVADEVGLGKTIVAQGVIRELMRHKKPLRVFYVCNSQAIARQNRKRILDLLDTGEQKAALCTVDRLSMMVGQEPKHPDLRLFTITPQTSFPGSKGRPRKGRWEERRKVADLLSAAVPRFLTPEERDEVFSYGVNGWIAETKRPAATRKEASWFKEALQAELGPGRLSTRLEQVLEEHGQHELVGRLRSALAMHALKRIHPDLVIFDEFQRFRELLAPARRHDLTEAENASFAATAKLHRALRGDDLPPAKRPALLLLSATPYRLYVSRSEEKHHGSHHEELFQVLDFLAGHGDDAIRQRAELVPLFRRFRDGLRLGQPDSEARKELIRGLTKRIARTERVGRDHKSDAIDVLHPVPVEREDLNAFRDLSKWFDEKDRGYVLPYWSSIPLPLQTMGPRYKAWCTARDSGRPRRVQEQWTKQEHARLRRPQVWPHPGVRAILERVLPVERLILPWVPPSRPWWPLCGAWANVPAPRGTEGPGHKLLVFSRFRALPSALSAILSFEAEREAFSGDVDWDASEREIAKKVDQLRKERRFTPSAKRESMLAYFWPSPSLAAIDVRGSDSPIAARERARAILEACLRSAGVRISDGNRQPQGAWRVLAWLDHAHLGAWSRLEKKGESALPDLVDAWRGCSKPRTVSASELTFLARLAVSAPGVVLARSLQRRVPTALSGHLRDILELSWKHLRTYLDEPVLRHAMKRATGAKDAPRALLESVEQGNLEATLDEHLWVLETCGQARGKDLIGALSEALDLRAGAAYVHRPGRPETFQVACRAAMPFSETRELVSSGTGERFRPDQLRQAFNSPFWPHVLATTSVGQEGLDFHLWCADLFHWDLPGNAVDLEQREGRIRRYCGLAVRQAFAAQFNGAGWDDLADQAGREHEGDHGLSPWWITPNSQVRRHLLDVPLSERKAELARLKRQRVLYRLALGQPDQEDLVEELDRILAAPEIEKWALELSPWFLQNG